VDILLCSERNKTGVFRKNLALWPIRSDPLLATSTPTTPTTPSVEPRCRGQQSRHPLLLTVAAPENRPWSTRVGLAPSMANLKRECGGGAKLKAPGEGPGAEPLVGGQGAKPLKLMAVPEAKQPFLPILRSPEGRA